MLKKYQLRSYNIRLVIALLITSGFGIIVINSANSAYTIRQCIGLAISLFLMAAVSFIDYNWILKYYWLIYIVNHVVERFGCFKIKASGIASKIASIVRNPSTSPTTRTGSSL